jgi:protein-S-isoprenylcysteine O-methyltransferase Ste14
LPTFSRSAANVILRMTVVFGWVPLIAFAVFLLTGSPGLINLDLAPDGVLWWDAGLCVAFFVQHSGMVRKSFRQWLSSLLPEAYGGAVYAIASGMVLLLVVVLWQKSSGMFMTVHGMFRWVFYAAYVLSMVGFAWGVRALGAFDPFGLGPILAELRGMKPRRMGFTVRGPYRWVRHPLYLFMLLMIWSSPDMSGDRLLFNALWTAWIVVGTWLEERDLVAEFGEVYREYQRSVPMLLPQSIYPIQETQGAAMPFADR